ncbi:MAG: superoxide dismutase [Chloroflexota bacterium]
MAPSHRSASRSLRTTVALALATLLTVAVAAPGLAARPGPSEIDLPLGWQPEGITAGPGTTVFVGSLAARGIWRGDVRSGDGAAIPGTEGTFGVGVEYEADANRLWVAGGPSGQVKVLDATSGELLETYQFTTPAFLNDLVVTDDAVYVTDSSNDWLDVIPIDADGSLADPGDAFMLPLTGDFSLQPGFNLNGIVEARGWLIAVQSNTGELFRIDPATGDTTEIALGSGVDVINGDGLEVHGRTLYVVQNQNNRVEVFALGPRLASATLQRTLTGNLDFPTTIGWVAGATYAVNARFTTPPTSTTPYWITRLGV